MSAYRIHVKTCPEDRPVVDLPDGAVIIGAEFMPASDRIAVWFTTPASADDKEAAS